MFSAYVLVITLLVLAIGSGHNEAIKNISLLATIVLGMTTFLSMFTKNESVPKQKGISKYIGRSMWFIAILCYAAYGLWIQCIAMILSIIFIMSNGEFYKEER